MKVFKFGGASICDAKSVKNMASIVRQHAGHPLLVVVSAMGKTTNAFEEVLRRKGNPQARKQHIETIRSFHTGITKDLFGDDPLLEDIDQLMKEVELHLDRGLHDDELYDRIVSYGEILSSRIIHAWLVSDGIQSHWLDARACIITDDHFREAHVLWDRTFQAIQNKIANEPAEGVILTQGFLGGTHDGRPTTLGREGSDFTAAIFATCLKAEHVTVWKDVEGIMNADPKRVPGTVKFEELPYHEAAEMTYYGASVIHPKTIKPLANEHIPLYVRSFNNPLAPGTAIRDVKSFQPLPAIILKDDQCLISFHVRDFTFVNEQNLSLIFHQLAEMDMKINMMQNSAISFSICVDYNESKLEEVLIRLKGHFRIRFNNGLQLITIKHYTGELINEYRSKSHILLEQMSRLTCQFLVEP